MTTACAAHLANLRPRDADVPSAAELQPAARERQVTRLIGATPAESDGGLKVTDISRRQRLDARHDGKLAVPQTFGVPEAFDRGLNVRQLLRDIPIRETEAARELQQLSQVAERRLVADLVHGRPELSEAFRRLSSVPAPSRRNERSDHQ